MHANIYKSLFYVQCESFNFVPPGLLNMKTGHFSIYKLVLIATVARVCQ